MTHSTLKREPPVRKTACAALVLTLGLAAVPACSFTPEATPAKAAQGAAAPAKVSTVKPSRGPLRRVTDQPARVEAAESTPVHAKLASYVKNVAVDVGDRVKTGQLLAELDAPEEAAGLAQKEALVEQANADRALAVASVAVAKSLVKS